MKNSPNTDLINAVEIYPIRLTQQTVFVLANNLQ